MARRFVYIIQYNLETEVFTTSEKAKEKLYLKGYKPNINNPAGVWYNDNQNVGIILKKELK